MLTWKLKIILYITRFIQVYFCTNSSDIVKILWGGIYTFKENHEVDLNIWMTEIKTGDTASNIYTVVLPRYDDHTEIISISYFRVRHDSRHCRKSHVPRVVKSSFYDFSYISYKNELHIFISVCQLLPNIISK